MPDVQREPRPPGNDGASGNDSKLEATSKVSGSQAQAVARDASLADAFTDSDLPSGPSLRAVASDAAALALADLTSLSGIAETEAQSRPEGAELFKSTSPANTVAETAASSGEAAAHSSASCCPVGSDFELKSPPLSAVKDMAALLRSNIEDAKFAEQGITRLRLALQQDNAKLKDVMEENTVELVIECLARNKYVPSLQAEGCRFLERTMRTNEGKTHGPSKLSQPFFQGLRVVVIMDAIRHHPLQGKVLEEAMKALGTLALDSTHQKVIGRAGGIDLLIHAMRRHPRRTIIQVLGCWAMTNLVTNVENQHKVSCDAAKREVVVTTITAAMIAHVDSASVLEQGCRALCNLAYHSGNTEAIASHGGIRCVLDAMANHLDNRNIQHHGCAVLCNGARDRSSLSVDRFGGLHRVLDAMDAYPFDAELMEVACKALASINWFVDKEVQNKTRELGGLDIVRRVQEAQAEHPVVAATCQQVMARIDEKPAPVDDPEDLYT